MSVATVITDGRYGTGTTEIFLTSPYCRSEYNNIRYCSLSSSGSQCSPVTCRYNRIGLKCYGNFNYIHTLLSLPLHSLFCPFYLLKFLYYSKIVSNVLIKVYMLFVVPYHLFRTR